MKILTVKFFMLLAFILPVCLQAQDLTGIWRGYFITEYGDQYKLEFQVTQSKSQTVRGVSYSYLDSRFYGKATMTGNFVKKNGAFSIQELRTVEVRNLGGGSTCLMNYKFTYVRSGKEEFLEGRYVGKTEDRKNPANNGKWGDCGMGTVFLRKVPTSDFYVEPFLRPVDTPKKQTAPPKNTTVEKKPSKPAVQPKKPVTEKTDSSENIRKPQPVIVEKPKEIKIKEPEITRSRKNDLVQTLVVNNPVIKVKLYDNGEIDGDTVSLYLNGALVLANQRLTTKAIEYTIYLEEDFAEQTLVMVAENMGRIPPNTALMIVEDGNKKHQLGITSTEQKNGMVRFRYQKSSD